jgi:hypothetical protein
MFNLSLMNRDKILFGDLKMFLVVQIYKVKNFHQPQTLDPIIHSLSERLLTFHLHDQSMPNMIITLEVPHQAK